MTKDSLPSANHQADHVAATAKAASNEASVSNALHEHQTAAAPASSTTGSIAAAVAAFAPAPQRYNPTAINSAGRPGPNPVWQLPNQTSQASLKATNAPKPPQNYQPLYPGLVIDLAQQNRNVTVANINNAMFMQQQLQQQQQQRQRQLQQPSKIVEPIGPQILPLRESIGLPEAKGATTISTSDSSKTRKPLPGSVPIRSTPPVKAAVATTNIRKTSETALSTAAQQASVTPSRLICDTVEEDPLPPTEFGIYNAALIRKRKWLQDCNTMTPLPPHTIGSANDKLRRSNATNTTMISPSCQCKHNRCLHLFCDCFRAVSLCGPRCNCRTQSCCNGNSLDDYQMQRRRRDAVWTALKRDRNGAFRTPDPEAACGNYACDCFQSGVFCDASQCPCPEGCHRIATTSKRYYMDPSVDKDRLGALNVTNNTFLAYSMPLHVNDIMAPGVSFTRADPRYESPASSRPAKQTQRTQVQQKLYHSLMLSPSKTIRSPQAAVKPTTQGTELEQLWTEEISKLSTFFRHLQNIADAQITSEDLTRVPEGSQEAVVIYKSVLEDMESVKHVVDAAKLNIMTVLYEQKKAGRQYRCRSGPNLADDAELELERAEEEFVSPEEMELRCNESMPPFEDLVHLLPESSDASRQLLIRAVQDTAMMRELARIIRRKARELAMMRAKKADT
ncbi:hypothetical protein MPSEU_000336200 [Mayamaea pseudoterrestris]|nr:hypothetical protein MPSEU_000336200 [Mayamaea pseudoterrestris]